MKNTFFGGMLPLFAIAVVALMVESAQIEGHAGEAKAGVTLREVMGSDLMGVRRSRRHIDEIIVHCTATPEGRAFTVEAIRNYHVRQRGFSDIGYHYIVYLDGTLHEGRDVDIVGAHCLGHNRNSIGVVYVGGLARDGKTPKDTRTPQQKEALRQLLKALKELYPNATVHGHNEYANKACPCFRVTGNE